MNVLVSYTARWRIKNNHNYVWTSCKKLINIRSGKEVKKTIKGVKAGYYINRKFVCLSDLKKSIELIRDNSCPF